MAIPSKRKKAASDDDEEEDQEESAYSRAFSKIISTSLSPDESMGPVLAARKDLVAKKLLERQTDEGQLGKKASAKREIKQQQDERHILPEPHVDAKEMALIKLATRGVVTLFNAVRKAQKVQSGSESLKARDAKARVKQSKAAFLSEIKSLAHSENTEEEQKPGWSVLQDDFMLGKSQLKDWDKQADTSSDEDGRAGNASDSGDE